jgi:hypothetical protein
MKPLVSVLSCLCILLTAGCLALLFARPSAAEDKPAPAAPQVGRYQRVGDNELLDTATGRLWSKGSTWELVYDAPK